jgi:hypothetical protein
VAAPQNAALPSKHVSAQAVTVLAVAPSVIHPASLDISVSLLSEAPISRTLEESERWPLRSRGERVRADRLSKQGPLLAVV